MMTPDQILWMGGGFGPWHWLTFVLFVALILYPVGRILARLGFSPLLSVFALVPIVNLAMLWVLAFARWDRVRR
jgi:hypothetical protein